jgi:acyl-CoA thioester hydrolase
MSFRHTTPIQIRFADLDALNHVNNANYLTYIELARIHYLHEVVKAEMGLHQEGLILAKATIDFKQPVLLTDEIVVKTRCNRLGNKSFEMEYEMLKTNTGGEPVLMATSSTVLVCLDYSTGKTVQVPVAWRQRILDFEAVGTVGV